MDRRIQQQRQMTSQGGSRRATPQSRTPAGQGDRWPLNNGCWGRGRGGAQKVCTKIRQIKQNNSSNKKKHSNNNNNSSSNNSNCNNNQQTKTLALKQHQQQQLQQQHARRDHRTTQSRNHWHGLPIETPREGNNFAAAIVDWPPASQQHASVPQGPICSHNSTFCFSEPEVVDQTYYLTQSQCTDTRPTSPTADPFTPATWQGSHRNTIFKVTGMTRCGLSTAKAGIESRSPAPDTNALPLGQGGDKN